MTRKGHEHLVHCSVPLRQIHSHSALSMDWENDNGTDVADTLTLVVFYGGLGKLTRCSLFTQTILDAASNVLLLIGEILFGRIVSDVSNLIKGVLWTLFELFPANFYPLILP